MQPLSQSQEDYLEAIHNLKGTPSGVCVRDISKRLAVSMPSVVGALRRLEKMGLAKHSLYDYVTLTPKGKHLAKKVAKRHAFLKRFLAEVLCVPAKTSEEDACAIEHHVSHATFEGLVKFFRQLEALPDKGKALLHIFQKT